MLSIHKNKIDLKILLMIMNILTNMSGFDDDTYCAYSLQTVYKIIIQVAGGGMMNGNAYANIEGEWATEDDYNNGEGGGIYYCEYGANPSRHFVGRLIEWDEDGYNFKITT